MPKISRVTKNKGCRGSTKPGEVKPEKPKLDKYACTRCGKIYTTLKRNFPASQSPLFMDNGYMPICNHCADELYNHYREVLGSNEEAMKRMCLKFDIYWSPELWKMMNFSGAPTNVSRIRQYISKTFLLKYIGKTYDDTLDEFAHPEPVKLEDVLREDSDEGNGEDAKRPDVDPETIMFWGAGFDEATYKDLNIRFDKWTRNLAKPLPTVEEALYKQICIQESQINKKAAAGQNIEQGQNALNNLLSSLNVKPNQKKDDLVDADLDSTPLGVWARKWEEHRPIPDSDLGIPESKLIKYITTWFYGHIAKALGLKNMYSQVYEDEIAKYRVTKPEYEGEDDDAVIADIVSGGDSS